MEPCQPEDNIQPWLTGEQAAVRTWQLSTSPKAWAGDVLCLASSPALPTGLLLGHGYRWSAGSWLITGLCLSRKPGSEPARSALPQQQPGHASQLLSTAPSAFACSTASSLRCQCGLSAKWQWVSVPLGCHHPGEAAVRLNLDVLSGVAFANMYSPNMKCPVWQSSIVDGA